VLPNGSVAFSKSLSRLIHITYLAQSVDGACVSRTYGMSRSPTIPEWDMSRGDPHDTGLLQLRLIRVRDSRDSAPHPVSTRDSLEASDTMLAIHLAEHV
jgi:heme A synthase